MTSVRVAEHPRPSHLILHLSDTHLLGRRGLLYSAVDSAERLRRVLAGVDASRARPNALVFTGDLADEGEPDAYRRLRDIVEPIAERAGATVIWAMGNHDNRASFRTQLLDQQPSMAPIDVSYDVDGLRVITLDTSVPGHHHGEITRAQLSWLANELATPASYGTLLALHHPPVPCVLDLAVLVELRDQQSLAEVVRGTDVRAILAGHLHYSTSAMFAGIPVSVAAATCYNQDLQLPPGEMRGQDGGQGYNTVHVYPDTVVHSVVPIGHHATVGERVGADEGARRRALAGVRIAEAADEPFRRPQGAVLAGR